MTHHLYVSMSRTCSIFGFFIIEIINFFQTYSLYPILFFYFIFCEGAI